MASVFDTRVDATGADIPSADDTVRINGYTNPGDGGGGLYRRMATTPPLPAKAWQFKSHDGAWWQLAELMVNPLMLGAIGDGSADDLAALTALFATFSNIDIPQGRTFRTSDSLTVSVAGARIGGGGTIALAAGKQIDVTADGASIAGIRITGPLASPALYYLRVSGDDVTVRDCVFAGAFGNYVRCAGARVAVVGNTFDGTDAASGTAAVVFLGTTADGCKFLDNYVINARGFGVQTLLGASNILIRGNTFRSRWHRTEDQPANGSKTAFAFTFDEAVSRVGLRVNGRPVETIPASDPAQPNAIVLSGSGASWTATFPTAPASGTQISLVGFISLERVNINSESYNIDIVDNDIQGSGDSGIVLCADYHNGVLDPTHVTAADYPVGIIVRGNTVIESMNSGIAMTHACRQVVIADNNIREYGYDSPSLVYSAGVTVSTNAASPGPVTVRDNIIQGNGVTTRCGVTWNGYVGETYSGTPDNPVKFGQNLFLGSFDLGKYYIPNGDPSHRKSGLWFGDVPSTPYPAQIDLDTAFAGSNKPADNAYFSYGQNNSGWVRDTSDKLGGVASVVCTGGTTGAYVQASLLATQALLGTVLRARVWAKADAGSGSLSIHTTISGNYVAVTVPVTSDTWKPYEVFVPISTADQAAAAIIVRAGAAVGGKVHLQHFHISSQQIPND